MTLATVLFVVTYAWTTPACLAVQPAVADSEQDEWDDFEELSDDEDFGDEEGVGPGEVEIHGFASAAAASRLVRQSLSPSDYILGEVRGRLDMALQTNRAKAQLKFDILADGINNKIEIDVRDISVDLVLSSWLSVRAGRQVLTWGTGDFLFLNDLFPKDFQAFFVGRADEFLKAPSNAVRFSLFVKKIGLDIVWTPVFTPDRFLSGERLSFFFPLSGSLIGPVSEISPVSAQNPSIEVENGEWAGRLYTSLKGWELSAYGYVGFFKQPLSIDIDTGELAYSRLLSGGASLRGLLQGGVSSLEMAYYHSVDDAQGQDPFLPNSQIRFLASYEREWLRGFTVGVQYYLEAILNHGKLIRNSPQVDFEPDEYRHVLTTRMTYRLFADNLVLSLFAFVSPSDVDAYIRPVVSYKFSDDVEIVLGGNLFFGRDSFSFFGQLVENTNAYIRLRFSF